MRPSEVSKERIVAAGELLVSNGKPVTGYALRFEVGGGMAARLKAVWEQHLAEKKAAPTIDPIADLPIEVAERFVQLQKDFGERLAALAAELNLTAVKTAERRVAEVIRAAEARCEQADLELSDGAATVEALESRLESAEAANRDQAAQIAAMKAEHQTQAVEIAQLRERLVHAEEGVERERAAARAERENHQAQAERARGELASLESAAQAERKKDQANAADAREEAARLQGKLELATTQYADLLRTLGERDSSKERPG